MLFLIYTFIKLLVSATTIQKKWKSIRDAFSRELKKNHLKSGSGVKNSKPYAYFNNLLFLKPLYETKPKKDEQDNTDVNEIVNIEDGINDNDDSNDASDITVETTRSSSSGKRKNEENLFKILADNIIKKKEIWKQWTMMIRTNNFCYHYCQI